MQLELMGWDTYLGFSIKREFGAWSTEPPHTNGPYIAIYRAGLPSRSRLTVGEAKSWIRWYWLRRIGRCVYGWVLLVCLSWWIVTALRSFWWYTPGSAEELAYETGLAMGVVLWSILHLLTAWFAWKGRHHYD